MDTSTEMLIRVLRDRMVTMTMQQRLDLIDELRAGYCQHCGCDMPDGDYCHCANDE